ncbi:MAG TPA: PhzF family phenazine biosynthesis protein [Gammaproteobacteria bacterium]|nr:PhzF family phenazine biosynthesis protein [Gammaproteobacteria bacterium]
MRLRLFQVDAFAERPFEGNPAAVCPLDAWLDDVLLQAIAEENNLSETAFFVPAGDAFELRWFTPVEEVDLCGHATLASAHVLFEQLDYRQPAVRFETRSGVLTASKNAAGLTMDFPAAPPEPLAMSDALAEALGRRPSALLAAFDYVAVYESEDDIRALAPDFAALAKLDKRGVVATAPGREVDFVSRCFFPALRINEDPVTGSAHCETAPYWAGRLGGNRLEARQLSQRGGAIGCEVRGDRVSLTGRAASYLVGEIVVQGPSGS